MSVLVRTSERGDFLKCRQLWYWRWVDRYQPIEEQPALEFGDYVHQALAIYYQPGRKRGPKPAETFEKIMSERTDSFNMWSDGEWTKALDLGVGMLERYHERWKDADQEYEVISSEQTFELPIGRVLGERIIYVGTFDGVWRHLPTKKIRFPEHKTGVSIVTDALALNEQAGAYWAYGPRWLRLQRLLEPDEELDGIIYNFLRKSIPDSDAHYDEQGRKLNKPKRDALLTLYGTLGRSVPKRVDGKKGVPTIDAMMEDLGEAAWKASEPSLVQATEFFHREPVFRGPNEAEMVKRRIKQQVRDMIVASRDPEEYVYKNPGPQFMPNCRFCSFKDICEVHETGNNWKAMIPALYTVWNPYDAHEKVERT